MKILAAQLAQAPDDEDATAIVGNPELDLEELEEIAPDVADAVERLAHRLPSDRRCQALFSPANQPLNA
ncbi:MAG: hypothetical protein ACI8Y4_002980 [Candidatus Poriferisodalaceae bacterium]